MRKYKKPEFHFVRNSGGLSDEEIVKLSDDQLTQYLKQDSMLQEKEKVSGQIGFYSPGDSGRVCDCSDRKRQYVFECGDGARMTRRCFYGKHLNSQVQYRIPWRRVCWSMKSQKIQ